MEISHIREEKVELRVVSKNRWSLNNPYLLYMGVWTRQSMDFHRRWAEQKRKPRFVYPVILLPVGRGVFDFWSGHRRPIACRFPIPGSIHLLV